MDEFDQIFITIANCRGLGEAPVMACLYTGAGTPDGCAPMPRSPEPAIGMPFDDNFADRLMATLTLNPAVHDGAILVGRAAGDMDYRVTGWSHRLFPPAIATVQFVNRGSAFNSCLAMSMVQRVDCLYLVARRAIHRFQAGSVSLIYDAG